MANKQIKDLSAKAQPVDTDQFAIDDASNSTWKVTMANLRKWLFGTAAEGNVLYFDSTGDWIPLAVGTTGQFLKTQGAANPPAWASVNSLKSVTIYVTGSGTYTVPAGIAAIEVELSGGGGGGGGADGDTSKTGCGGGGGSGGFVRKLYTSPSASYSYGVGAAGAGGTAGNNAGTDGGNTTFGALTGSGGVGGSSLLAGTTNSGAAGGAGGAAAGGDVNIPGAKGQPGRRADGTLSFGGAGAVSRFGGGGSAPASNSAVGGDGSGYGSGGAGATANSATDRAGGDGKVGIIIIREFGA